MCRHIRAGMVDESFHQLTGFVEMDKAYIGGKDKWKHHDKKGDGPRGGKAKMTVLGAVQRGGKVIARAVDKVDSRVLAEFNRETISHCVSLLSTDDSAMYPTVAGITRKSVNHSKGEDVVGAIHTNTIEGIWSQFKRGVVGTFHKVTAKYLPLYLTEFEFRYNNRMNFGAAVATC